MEKILFKHKWNSYLLVSVIGIIAGFLVHFFSQFPSDDLWGLSLFSSQTFGFWIFTSSLIALFSSKHYVAGINVAFYVYFMFYITGIFKRLAIVNKGYNEIQYFWNGLWQELTYGLLPAAICFVCAFVMWFGRKNKLIFVLLRFVPILFILAEAILSWFGVINRNQGLFMAVIDTASAIGYLMIILRESNFKT